MCWSKEASTRQHKKSLVSGTIGAFRLCSDERTSRCTYREHSVKLKPCLFHLRSSALQVFVTKIPQPCKVTAVVLQPPSRLRKSNNNATSNTKICSPPLPRVAANSRSSLPTHHGAVRVVHWCPVVRPLLIEGERGKGRSKGGRPLRKGPRARQCQTLEQDR